MKKNFSLVIGAVLFSTILPGIKANAEVLRNINGVQAIQATTQNGWVQDNGVWYFYKNGSLVKGWLQDNGSWYYLDPTSGSMKKDWQQINGIWYYLDPVYGYMRTSWQQINGSWYYLDPTNGDMKTGWQQINNKWYYLDPTYGYMRTGWQKIDGKEYYFLPSEGSMASNTFIDGYYLGSDGAKVDSQNNQQKIVNEALYWKGKIPYLSPTSYNWKTGILDKNNPPARMDCSDFTSAVYATALGIRFQDWTGSQMAVGRGIEIDGPRGGNYSNLVPGDLIIFAWPGGDSTNGDHVAIYIGNGQIVHESGTNSAGGNVKVNSLNENWGAGYGYIRNNIISIRRVI